MRFINLIFTAVLISAFCGNAMAELKLVSFQMEERDSSYGQVLTKDGHAYWVLSGASGEKAFLRLQPFSDTGFRNQKVVPVSSIPLALAQRSNSAQKDMLIVGADAQGSWQVLQIDERLAKVKKAAEIKSIAFATEVASVGLGYAIGGSNQQDAPTAVLLSEALANHREVSFPTQKKGETSSVFVNQGKFFAIANYADASADLHELTFSGDLRSSIRLRGGAATGIPLRDGGIAISYRVGRQLFVERFDAKLKSLWSIKLHDIKGVSTKKYQLLELPGTIACVGGNEGRLVVHRIGDDGKTIQTSADQEHGFRIPPNGFYSSIAIGNEIHIRGQARKKDDPVDGSITSFYFVEGIRK